MQNMTLAQHFCVWSGAARKLDDRKLDDRERAMGLDAIDLLGGLTYLAYLTN